MFFPDLLRSVGISGKENTKKRFYFFTFRRCKYSACIKTGKIGKICTYIISYSLWHFNRNQKNMFVEMIIICAKALSYGKKCGDSFISILLIFR